MPLSENIPTEEEFEVVLTALGYYKGRARELIMNEEVLKATQRLSTRANKAVSENEVAFEAAFAPAPVDALKTFITDLTNEIDTKAIQVQANRASDDLTVLSAKIIKLRDLCRESALSGSIDSLLK